MTDYFTEMGWEPHGPRDLFLQMARLLRDFNMFEELGTTNRIPPPANKTAVENLPDIKLTVEDSQCPICLKEGEVELPFKKMPCGHKFHPECILPWLAKTNSCPVCRYELPTDDEEYEAYRKEKIRAKQRESDIEQLHNSMFS